MMVLCKILILKHDRVVPLPSDVDLSILSYTELVSVSLHAINRFEKSISNRSSFGIWGDGESRLYYCTIT